MEMKGNEKKVKEALHQLARPNQSLGVTSLMGGLHFRGFLASVKKFFFLHTRVMPPDKTTKRDCLACNTKKRGRFEQYHVGTNCIGKVPVLLTFKRDAQKGKDGIVCTSCAHKNRILQVCSSPFP